MTGFDLEGPVDVLVVDDDPLVRAGLLMILGGADGIRVVGEAGEGAEALRLLGRCAAHVVLMDIRMPVMDGLAATEALRARPAAPEVLVLTTFDADDHVLRALRAGAAGNGGDRRGAAQRRLAMLNDREREVAGALGRGLSNAEIGAQLYLGYPRSRGTSPAS